MSTSGRARDPSPERSRSMESECMSERFLVLRGDIQSDLERIEEIYTELGQSTLSESDSEERLIVIAYRLHNLYSAFENIFRNIARAFENHLDPSAWHRQLLQRMRLDLSPVRPAVIDDVSYEKLDELLRFRHLFRTGYGLKLDPRRLQLVLDKAVELKPLYRLQIERFDEFLGTAE
jgi:hypothetical protein